MYKKTLLLSSAAMLIMASPAKADKMSMDEIQAQLQQLSAQVQNLSKVVQQQNATIQAQEAELAAQKQASAEALANIAPAAGGSNVKISMKPSPKIESADGKYSFQPLGRAHFDVTHFDDDQSDQDSNMNLRRARLGAKGKLGNDLSYKVEADFAEEAVSLKSFYLKYSGLDTVDVTVGNHKPQFGLQNRTSSNYIQLMERSGASNAFTRSEILGASVSTGGDNWAFEVGAFGEDAGNDDTGNDEDTSVDVAGSVNVLGLTDDANDNVLHLGAGYSHRRPTDSGARFRARPGTGDGPRVVDTGTLSEVDKINVYNLEAATVLGPFSAQAEYFMADVSRDNGFTDAEFDGYYAQAGWFITGESRPYSGKSGKFGRVKPKNPFDLKSGGTGAVELVARYENLDLNDASAGVTGGELDMIVGGINWHLNNNVRVMGNIIDVDTDNNAVVADDDPTVYSLRTQWDF